MLFLDQQLKNRLAYLNFNAIFEFLGQFTIGCLYKCIIVQKDVDNFEIEHKTCLFWNIFGVGGAVEQILVFKKNTKICSNFTVKGAFLTSVDNFSKSPLI